MNDISNVKVHLNTRSGNVNIVLCMTLETALKERISSQREQILSFKNSPHFEKGHY